MTKTMQLQILEAKIMDYMCMGKPCWEWDTKLSETQLDM